VSRQTAREASGISINLKYNTAQFDAERKSRREKIADSSRARINADAFAIFRELILRDQPRGSASDVSMPEESRLRDPSENTKYRVRPSADSAQRCEKARALYSPFRERSGRG